MLKAVKKCQVRVGYFYTVKCPTQYVFWSPLSGIHTESVWLLCFYVQHYYRIIKYPNSINQSQTNNWLFHLFHCKTGLVAAVVSKAIAGWIRVSGSHPQRRSGGQQLQGPSPLTVLPPVGEPCRQPCTTGFRKIMYVSKEASSKGDTGGFVVSACLYFLIKGGEELWKGFFPALSLIPATGLPVEEGQNQPHDWWEDYTVKSVYGTKW